ncbi:MAG: carboxypeptidase regulatory-like domain-containing protein, partial [Coprococcus sp.]
VDCPVDYVTLTVGGNDVGFADIITTCATGSTYLHFGSDELKLQKEMDELWDNFDTTRANIKQVYKDIKDAAGSQAEIIVAGYPKLLDKEGKGFLISKEEATIVNNNVTKFNDEIEAIVNECREEGMNIHFVDVEEEFDKDGGHQAYSSDAWINKIILGNQNEDLDYKCVASAYSVHPNEEGAKAYARCVNAKIAEIENNKQTGTLSGKICKASDHVSPISSALVFVYKDNNLYTFTIADNSGNYSLTLPEGEYRIKIVASGYIDFIAYESVINNTNTYMETFLLVEGFEGETGIANGRVYDGLTGNGIDGVTLTIRKGWNNSDIGDIITTTMTDSSGAYSLTLPLGNYTVNATKNGYISATFNIIIQNGTTNQQNGTMTPIVSGDGYRIVLTWGENPRDLDSHVEGTLSDGANFHVYYNHKSQYDGNIEVCNLDVDDVTSYGPETITLNPTTDDAYYYYIYRYAGSGTVASSAAQIKVYQGETLLRKFNVPTDLGDSDYWNVFAIKNGSIIIQNTITDYADTSYAE